MAFIPPPVAEPPYSIEVRNAARRRVGQVDRLTSLELTPAYNAVGGWTMTIPAGSPQEALFAKGGWISVSDPSTGEEIFTGQVRGRKRTRSDNEPFLGMRTFYGPSAEQLLADRLAFQVPGQPATAQSAAEYDRRANVGETTIKRYVDLNCGPNAIPTRRTPGLVIEPDAGRGKNVTASARMTPMLDLIGPLAETAGLGFRIRFNPAGDLEFQVYVPTDKAATARFGIDLGNLTSYEQVEEAPKASAAIVGGSGDGTARVFREVLDSDAVADWGIRAEVFVDQAGAATADELDQAGAEQVVSNGPVNGLTIEAIDTRHLRFFRDYYLGDRVTAEDVTDILRGVTINWSAADGLTAKSTVGTSSVTGTKRMIKRLADLTAKVAALQAKQ
ncbi:siphovirus ReqiPepy6 Gp37-like family protein [Actinomadura opuntiae]|uniref:siphovirus ReqiPepy6 Gp37-like family protein n=1 Tax=Actinomadura sp. OS1-43 TaxID=604315 RepID=UPI00255B1E7B|nr:siphovirus ReqiPepy6 Gp37-like family protein [Actinomadura sp. OS1-43]MDL4812823.1 siphovirus ReqiPepy6 Gp37-like family protein [Actinomadura sp. OS1-43]